VKSFTVERTGDTIKISIQRKENMETEKFAELWSAKK